MALTQHQPTRPAGRPGLRAHWLALALYALYLLRWAQYVQEALAYRTQPESGGAGDALGWLLLGQLWFAGLFGLGLLANALWRRHGRRFYLGLTGLVILPWLLQLLIGL
jgi:hypothetical protein